MRLGLFLDLVGQGAGLFEPSATLALDFTTGRYRVGAGGYSSPDFASLPNLTVTRATPSVAYGTTSAGVLVPFAANVARITDQGLLVEEARVNSIRNNTMAGATSSTFPTNWTTSAAGGITPVVVGTGTENGLTYIDVQLSGTPSASGTVVVAPDGVAANSGASQTQNWTASTYSRIVAGSLTNLTVQVFINENTSGGVFLSGSGTTMTPTAAFGRYTHTRTLASATTAGCYASLNFAVTNGQAVNLTIRLYLPQLELGAFVTSPIPTTSASVTRAADSVSIGGLTPPSAVTLFAEATASHTPVGNEFPVSLDDSSSNNRIQWFHGTAAPNDLLPRVVVGGVDAWPGNITSGFPNVGTSRVAVAVTAGRSQAAAGGVLSTAGAPTAVPAYTTLHVGTNESGAAGGILNGYVRKAVIYPAAQSNAQLQALTT